MDPVNEMPCATCNPPDDYVSLPVERYQELRGRCMVLLDGVDVTTHCMGVDLEHDIVLIRQMDEDEVFVRSCEGPGRGWHGLTYAYRGEVSLIEFPEGKFPDEELWRAERKTDQEAKIAAKILARESTCAIGNCVLPPEVVEFGKNAVTWLCYEHRNELRDQHAHGPE